VNLPEDDRIAPPERGDDGVPAIEDDKASTADGEEQDLRSLREDVEALIEDGKTYLETELIYQKTRAAFVADRAKGAVIYGAVAAAFGVLALIGLTVGVIIALTPLLTAWGASALVVGLLLIAAFLAMQAASRRWNRLMQAIEGTEPRP
jgi:Flp pilus assembly protein TadB